MSGDIKAAGLVAELRQQVGGIAAIVRRAPGHVAADRAAGFEVEFLLAKKLEVECGSSFEKEMVGLAAQVHLQQGGQFKTMDGGIVVAGTAGANGFDVSGNHGGDDFWLVKLNSNTNEVHTLTESQLVKLYPMPVTEKLVVSGLDNPIKCSIFDISGKCVYIINAINSNFEIDFSSFKNGIYFFKADGMKGRTFIKN